ncbi:hypothetical protein T03_14202 [Trichinella britovi]|uniref:Uncharacterized protein n=1 Tax=Trichinella britovi TaxID=45882 RepID=A0A0V1C7U2_TRIBR|nr:hypothetical protein T03_14202 [Trichinella britovi]
MIKRTNFLKECESVCWRRKYANWQWTVFLMIFKRAVRIDSQQSRRAVVGARKTITNRSFVCDARTPLYHTLAQVRFQPRQQRQNEDWGTKLDSQDGGIKRVIVIVHATENPWKKSAFVATTGKLYLLITFVSFYRFVWLMRECEALQEVIGRLIGRKQAQKAKNTNRSINLMATGLASLQL